MRCKSSSSLVLTNRVFRRVDVGIESRIVVLARLVTDVCQTVLDGTCSTSESWCQCELWEVWRQAACTRQRTTLRVSANPSQVDLVAWKLVSRWWRAHCTAYLDVARLIGARAASEALPQRNAARVVQALVWITNASVALVATIVPNNGSRNLIQKELGRTTKSRAMTYTTSELNNSREWSQNEFSAHVTLGHSGEIQRLVAELQPDVGGVACGTGNEIAWGSGVLSSRGRIIAAGSTGRSGTRCFGCRIRSSRVSSLQRREINET